MAGINLRRVLKFSVLFLTIPPTIYISIISLVVAVPALQTHAFYLHRLPLIWLKNLDTPERFGFLHNQVTSFCIPTDDGECLHAWHILPLGLYQRKHEQIVAGSPGYSNDFTSTVAFQLLRDDPDARLVIYFHGTAGCLASGYRPESYRTLSSGAPDKIHVLAFDYRGYGYSSGTPSEDGLLIDAAAVTNWAIHVAGIPASKIVLFGQSLGTAVAIALSQSSATLDPPILFAGMVLVASFSDVKTLTETYRVEGVIPVLTPLARVSRLLAFFTAFLTSTWQSSKRIGEFVQWCEARGERYHITLIHAQDDTNIPCLHSDAMAWNAVNASVADGIDFKDLKQERETKKVDLEEGGWTVEWRTETGAIREERPKYGLHDRIMTYPVTSMAIFRAFQVADPKIGLSRG